MIVGSRAYLATLAEDEVYSQDVINGRKGVVRAVMSIQAEADRHATLLKPRREWLERQLQEAEQVLKDLMLPDDAPLADAARRREVAAFAKRYAGTPGVSFVCRTDGSVKIHFDDPPVSSSRIRPTAPTTDPAVGAAYDLGQVEAEIAITAFGASLGGAVDGKGGAAVGAVAAYLWLRARAGRRSDM